MATTLKYLSILILAGTVDYLLLNDPTNILMPKVRLTRYAHAVVGTSCNELRRVPSSSLG